jgi:hypothetical protein
LIKTEISELPVWLDCDDTKGQYVLRGTEENVKKAQAMLLEYVFYEVEITDEDLEALLLGGKDSNIVKFSGELGVRLNALTAVATLSLSKALQTPSTL